MFSDSFSSYLTNEKSIDFANDDYSQKIESLESELFTLLVNDFIQTVCSTLKSYKNNGLSLDNLVLILKLNYDDSNPRWDFFEPKIRLSREYQSTQKSSYTSLDQFSRELAKDIHKETLQTRKSIVPLLNKISTKSFTSTVTPTFYLNSPTLEDELETLLLTENQKINLHKEKLNSSLKKNMSINNKPIKV